MSIKIKLKPISQNEWCLILIFPTIQDMASYEKELIGNFETYLHLKTELLTVVINIPSNGSVLTFKGIKTTAPQRVQIEDQKVTYISFWNKEIDLPIDTHCQYANVKYPQS